MICLDAKKSVKDLDLDGKRVLVRVDYNVTFAPGPARISDDSRIRASLPTIEYLVERRCKVILCSHIGRPKGRGAEEVRMAPVTERLSELFGRPVSQAPGITGPETRAAVEAMDAGEVVLLENLRFDPREEANDREFASELAGLADVYVDDAFGTAHRAHASTDGVTHYLPAVSGLLLARELEVLGGALESPERPFAAILGGAKVSDKIAVLENLAGTVDLLVVGGGMAATFMLAKGLNVGDSLVEEDRVPFARRFMDSAGDKGTTLLLPVDLIVADAFSEDADRRTVDAEEVPPGWRIMDIGPRSADAFEEELSRCKTVVWNGPMGVFEWEPFAGGTTRIAEALAGMKGAVTIVGGGSTAEAVERFGVADRMTHVSTGGGASLELLEGKTLPGVEALLDAD